jgi:hypothetical protein
MLEKGSLSNPTGNLVVYARVIGENPFDPDCEYIASNVIISYLRQGDSLPVVTFPPVSFPDLTALQNVLNRYSDTYDIIRLKDFIMPSEKEAINEYLRERMDEFNQIIAKYVELCKNKEKNKEKEKKYEEIYDFFKELVEYSVQYRSSTGLTKEIAKAKVNSLAKEISNRYPAFDIDNYINVIYKYKGQIGDELATLYLKKFQAIHKEEYEKASQLKRQIQNLEANFI